MDAAMVNAFTDVIVNTFQTSVSAEPFRCTNFKKVEGSVLKESGILCVLPFNGAIEGSLAIHLPESTAMAVYKAMMFEDAKNISEVVEALGEILNIVNGNVKASLQSKGKAIKFDKAQVTNDPPLQADSVSPWLLVPMAFKELGRFDIFIAMK